MPTVSNEEFTTIIAEVMEQTQQAVFDYINTDGSEQDEANLKQTFVNISVKATNKFCGYNADGVKESKAV
jgi:hypothetical protein